MNAVPLCPGVWQIEESYRVYCVLLAGRSRCILLDTGLGKQDLRQQVEALAGGLPCTVLCSHGHADHVGGTGAFGAFFLHPADRALLTEGQAAQMQPVLPGAMLDPGGLPAVVVGLPGHTAGSIGLLLPEQRLLLAGDALCPRLLLPEPETGLEALRQTLPAALDLPFDTYVSGHTPGLLPKAQIAAHLAHLQAYRPEETRPARFGTLRCRRSMYKGPEGRSVFLLAEDTVSALQS